MIRFPITNANKRVDHTNNGWWVTHPSNGAILAYCDLEEEADYVIANINRWQRSINAAYDANPDTALDILSAYLK